MQIDMIKWIHILSATVLFGTGLGIAYFKWAGDRLSNVAAIDQINGLAVKADWLFTTPAILVQVITGVILTNLNGYYWHEPWLLLSMLFFFVAGSCWLPVVALQIRMRRLSTQAITQSITLNAQYQLLARRWFWLGVPAFLSLIVVFFLMAVKPVIPVLF
ncbi:MAG: DUF2269 domain-containing protein [Gammaproteobacteria bacterium]|jgi:uncharacterized membrane protein